MWKEAFFEEGEKKKKFPKLVVVELPREIVRKF